MNKSSKIIIITQITIIIVLMYCRASFIPSNDKTQLISESSPHCSVTVIRRTADSKIVFTGKIPGGGKLVSVVAPLNQLYTNRVDFDIKVDSFEFDIGYGASMIQQLIPMIFMFDKEGNHRYVCRLRFKHENGLPLTIEEINNMEITKQQ